jgi:hypothetical protein
MVDQTDDFALAIHLTDELEATSSVLPLTVFGPTLYATRTAASPLLEDVPEAQATFDYATAVIDQAPPSSSAPIAPAAQVAAVPSPDRRLSMTHTESSNSITHSTVSTITHSTFSALIRTSMDFSSVMEDFRHGLEAFEWEDQSLTPTSTSASSISTSGVTTVIAVDGGLSEAPFIADELLED